MTRLLRTSLVLRVLLTCASVEAQSPSEAILGEWTTTVYDREGVSRLQLDVKIDRGMIQWTVACDLPDGSSDHDSVATPVSIADGAVDILRRAGSFGPTARPCELGILEKRLAYSFDASGKLSFVDPTGKTRSFARVGGPVAAGSNVVPTASCTVTPPLAELRLGERGLFKVTAPGFTAPALSGTTRYVGDSSGGLQFAADANPTVRSVDVVNAGGEKGVLRLVRAYDLKPAKAANLELDYAAKHPGGIVETLTLTEGSRAARCEYRVRLLPAAAGTTFAAAH